MDKLNILSLNFIAFSILFLFWNSASALSLQTPGKFNSNKALGMPKEYWRRFNIVRPLSHFPCPVFDLL